MILIVASDLHQPGRDYPKIEKLLQKANGGSRHIQGSVWLIDTTNDVGTWRDRLRDAGDANDEYFVARFQHDEWASYGLDQDAADWLKSSSRRW